MKYLFILLIIVSTACSRDNDPDPNQQNTTELLIGKKWKLSAVSGKLANGTDLPDEYSNMPAHDKDDYWFFKSDLSYTYNANTVKESGDNNNILDDGTWNLTNSDTYIDLNSNDASLTYFPTKILSINSNTMEWESIDGGTTIWTTYTVIP